MCFPKKKKGRKNSCENSIKQNNFNEIMSKIRGCGSNGRALALHVRGMGFDAPHLHFFSNISIDLNS